jgi:hypothetical protein
MISAPKAISAAAARFLAEIEIMDHPDKPGGDDQREDGWVISLGW